MNDIERYNFWEMETPLQQVYLKLSEEMIAKAFNEILKKDGNPLDCDLFPYPSF